MVTLVVGFTMAAPLLIATPKVSAFEPFCPAGTSGAEKVAMEVLALLSAAVGAPAVCVQANVVGGKPGNFGTFGSTVPLALSVTVVLSNTVCVGASDTIGRRPGLTVIRTVDVAA